jgi:hypothetical protein
MGGTMNRLVTLLGLLAIFAAVTPAEELTFVVSFEDSTLRLGTTEGYDVVWLAGATSIPTPGAPSLPQRGISIVVPQGMRVVAVRANALESNRLPGRFCVYPSQPPVPTSDPGTQRLVPPDPAIYASHSPYPSTLAAVVGQGSMFGYNIASVLVTPVQYAPAESTLVHNRLISLALTIEHAELNYLPVGKRSAQTKARIEGDLRGYVLNPEDLNRFAPTPR